MAGQRKTDELDCRWLVGPEAAQWLAKLESDFDASGPAVLRLAHRLREQLSIERAHLLLEQLTLRQKATVKFSSALTMFFTRLGLEQATDQWVASYKASRFPKTERVADFCCGIGGDLIQLARRGPVYAVDRDAAAIVLAEANWKACRGEQDAQADVGLAVAEVDRGCLEGVAAWHIDPDRRPSGKRTTRVELHDPPPEILADLLAACPNAAIKLAPAATFEEPWWEGAELEWIGRGRQCRQLVAWFGSLAQHPGKRRATALSSASPDASGEIKNHPVHSFVGDPGLECEFTPAVRRYIHEPDPAVLAAKLEGALALQENLLVVAPGIAYFTSDAAVAHPLLASFEVLEVMAYRVKPLRQWLAARKMGRLEIKKRGVPNDPETVCKELQVAGEEAATILLAKIGGRTMAVVARRCTKPSG